MAPTSYPYSQQPLPVPILPSSISTGVSEPMLVNAGASYLQTNLRLKTSNSIGSTQSVLVDNHQLKHTEVRKRRGQITATMNCVSNGPWVNAPRRPLNADTSMSAESVAKTIRKLSANQSRVALEPRAKRPRYTWGLLWDNDDDTHSATAQWSLTAEPVPSVPA